MEILRKHPIWLERELPPYMDSLIPAEIEIVGWGDSPAGQTGLDSAEAVMAGSWRYDDTFFDRAPRLLTVCRTGIGYDLVDLEAANRRGIAVCNTPDAPTVSTAEHALTLILSVAKQIVPSQERLRSGSGNYNETHRAVELDGKTLGLVGFGRIARRVADMGTGLGLTATAYDPYLSDSDFPDRVRRVATLEELLSESDVVSLHLPATPHTRGMFNQAAFAAMKPGAVFVNTSRGTIVNHDSLLEAVDRGHLFGVGLDVSDPEPLPPDHPLLRRPNVIVTPHIASTTTEGRARLFEAALAQAVMVLNGERPTHLVNGQAWDQVYDRWAALRQ